jgi:phosphoglycolate phosphatase
MENLQDNSQQTGAVRRALDVIKQWLGRLSFRTGVIVLSLCVPCYVFSFAQMALPISAKAKGVLWVVFFGLAKTFQYGGLTILGVEGWKRLKARFRRR